MKRFFISLLFALLSGPAFSAWTTVRTLTATTSHGYSATALIQADGNIWRTVVTATDAPPDIDWINQTGSWNVTVNGLSVGDNLTAAQSPMTIEDADNFLFSTGDDLVFEVQSSRTISDNSFTETANASQNSTMPAPVSPTPTFMVSFEIPFNNSPNQKYYVAYQNENVVGILLHAAGASTTMLQVGPLVRNEPVTLFIITGGSVGDDGTNIPVITNQTEMVGVNTGNPIQGGVTVGNTSTPPTNVPAIQTPSTTSGSNVSTPSGGNGLVTITGTSSATTGATTSNVIDTTIAIQTSANAIISNAATNANAVIGAVNKSITALDKINSNLDKLNARGSGTDMTQTNALLISANQKLTDLKDTIQANRASDAAAKIVSDEALVTTANTATSQGISQGSNEGNSLRSTIEGRQLVGLGGLGSGSASALQFPLGTFGTINLDPASSPLISTFATWVKGVIAWMVWIAFNFWLWKFLFELLVATSLAPQAKGNTVAAGTGGQATSLVAAGFITAAIANVPVLFWAAADSGVSWASGITSNPFDSATGVLGTGVYLAGQFLPIGTILSSLSTMLLMRKAGLGLFALTSTIIRFIIP